MIRLHINIDHIATLRNARGTSYPDPVLAAQLCELAGADGITVHLREDRRHIRDDDVVRLRGIIGTTLNLEMAATEEMRSIAEQVRPDVITLVPERREELTTEGGLDLVSTQEAVAAVAATCQPLGIKLSVFIGADLAQVELARGLGAHQVEFHTGDYAHARDLGTRYEQLARLREAAQHAHSLGLEVAAGHGLTRFNVQDIAAIAPIVELNIGHAIISDAVFMGLDQAVREMRSAIERGIAKRY